MRLPILPEFTNRRDDGGCRFYGNVRYGCRFCRDSEVIGGGRLGDAADGRPPDAPTQGGTARGILQSQLPILPEWRVHVAARRGWVVQVRVPCGPVRCAWCSGCMSNAARRAKV